MITEVLLPGQEVGKAILSPKLVHGSRIVTVVSGDEDVSDCDALITSNHSLTLGIRTADCAPICFGDDAQIGIAHVGWRGLCGGLIEKMIENFDANTLSVYVGPFLHTFEIKKDFCYDEIIAKFGEHFLHQENEVLIFDFKRAIESLLPRGSIYDVRNTGDEVSLPSHRRGSKERLVTTVRLA